MGLFDMGGGEQAAINLPPIPDIEEWDDQRKLASEKEALGFYITGHPLNRYADIIEKFADTDTLTLKETHDGKVVRIGGLIRSTKVIRTKKGDLMAFATVEDLHGAVEVTIFSSVYAKTVELLVEDSAVLVQGQVQKDENAVKILADAVIPMEKAEELWTASVHFHLDVDRTDRMILEEMKNLIMRHPGSCRGFVHLRTPGNTETVIALPETMKLKTSRSLRREIDGLLGYNAMVTVCRPAQPALTPNNSNRNHRRGRFGHA